MKSMNGAWLALGVAGAVAAAGVAMGRGGSRNDEDGDEDEDGAGSMAYRSMAQIRRANKTSGGHWFERDSMRFFGSKIEGGPYNGRYFVTSEVDPGGKKAYSVREAADNGGVSTVGDFHAYGTKAEAVRAAKAMGGSANSAPTYRLIESGSKFKIFASPSNVVVATGSKTKMMKKLSELRALSTSGSRDLENEATSGSRAKGLVPESVSESVANDIDIWWLVQDLNSFGDWLADGPFDSRAAANIRLSRMSRGRRLPVVVAHKDLPKRLFKAADKALRDARGSLIADSAFTESWKAGKA